MKLEIPDGMHYGEVVEHLTLMRKLEDKLTLAGDKLLLREDIFGILETVNLLRFREAWLETGVALFSNQELAAEMSNYNLGVMVPMGETALKPVEQGALKNLNRFGTRIGASLTVTEQNCQELTPTMSYLKGLGVRYFRLLIKPALESVFPLIKEAWDFATKNHLPIVFQNYQRELSILLNHMFTGPIVVQFEITNKCNHKCVFCYHHSPHLLKKGDAYFETHPYNEELVERPASWHKQAISFGFLKEYVKEAARLGCGYIQLGGGGEPTTHPDIMAMLRYIKRLNLKVQVFTNLTVLGNHQIKQIVRLGLDVLEVNVSAVTPETYAKVHSVPKTEFQKLVDNLNQINRMKLKLSRSEPEIRIMNPICSLNFQEIPNMVDFALRHGASAVYFGHLQTTPLTRYLLLKPGQIRLVNKWVKEAIRRASQSGLKTNFSQYLDVLNYKETLKGSHTRRIYNRVGCLMSFYETQVHLDGSIAPCCLHPPIFNARSMGFGEMWNSAEYTRFRERVLQLYKKKEKPYLCRGCRMCVYQEDIQRFYTQLGPLAKYLKK